MPQTKDPQAAARRTRLFARLLCDSYNERIWAGYRNHVSNGLLWYVKERHDYLTFLRREVKRHPAYLLALRQIEAAHGR